jgi:hypothetical protein
MGKGCQQNITWLTAEALSRGTAIIRAGEPNAILPAIAIRFSYTAIGNGVANGNFRAFIGLAWNDDVAGDYVKVD